MRELSKQQIDEKYKKLKIAELVLENDTLYRIAPIAYGEP